MDGQRQSMSVCLSVSNITAKQMIGFSWNFQDISGNINGARNNLENFDGVKFNPVDTRFRFLFFFQENQCLSATLRENGSADFHQISRKGWTWDKRNCNIVGIFQLTLLIKDYFFTFSRSVLVISWINGWTDFHEISICHAWQKK